MKRKSIFIAVFITATLFLFSGCKKEEYGKAQITNPSPNTVTINAWTVDYEDDYNFNYSSSITWAAITQDVKDNGIVLVYLDSEGMGWTALPFSSTDYDSIESLNYTFDVGKIYLEISGYEGTDYPSVDNYAGLTFRIVIVLNVKSYPDVNWDNYNEVKEVLQLKD